MRAGVRRVQGAAEQMRARRPADAVDRGDDAHVSPVRDREHGGATADGGELLQHGTGERGKAARALPQHRHPPQRRTQPVATAVRHHTQETLLGQGREKPLRGRAAQTELRRQLGDAPLRAGLGVREQDRERPLDGLQRCRGHSVTLSAPIRYRDRIPDNGIHLAPGIRRSHTCFVTADTLGPPE